MDVWTSFLEGEQLGVWVILSIIFAVFSFGFMPLLYLYRRNKFRTQISSHVVTSNYKLPEQLSPSELSYLFSPSIKKRHMVASTMQMLNDGVLVTHSKEGKLFFAIGPKVDSKISLADAFMLDTIESREDLPGIDDFLSGNTEYKVPNTNEKVEGSRNYVFWWLVREGLRQRDIVVRRPAKQYFMVELKTLLLLLGVSVLTIFTLQVMSMSLRGEIDFAASGDLLMRVVSWTLIFFPLLFLSAFIVVRIKGKLLGRGWILSGKKKRLLGQFDAFREYVRLVQLGKVSFENDDAEKSEKTRTLPYAVALGYAQIPPVYASIENK